MVNMLILVQGDVLVVCSRVCLRTYIVTDIGVTENVAKVQPQVFHYYSYYNI